MASLCRLNRLQCLRNGLKTLTTKQTPFRAMSALPNNVDTKEGGPPKKIWVSYGFDFNDEKRDRHFMHMSFFATISICIVGGAYAIAFAPDPGYHNWAQREAYLQIRYREEHGLPMIDPDVIDPATVVLPTEEELGDTEIII